MIVAALAVHSVIELETTHSLQGALPFPKHELNMNSVRIRFSNQWIYSFRSAMFEEKLRAPRATHSSFEGILYPVAPSEMVDGADQQPRALGTWLPVYWTVV